MECERAVLNDSRVVSHTHGWMLQGEVVLRGEAQTSTKCIILV
jgi:hypothetical protein